MKKFKIYQVDAFASQLFKGNPAAVIPLPEWLPTETMQSLAVENNLSETVFFIPSKNKEVHYEIRWFTPGLEINLCGHATLAASYIIFEQLGFTEPELRFNCKSGMLRITRDGSRLRMDFPSWKPERIDDYSQDVITSLGNPEIVGVYRYRDMLIELNDEAAVKNCTPDFTLMKKTGEKVIITARGTDADFVSRFFAPAAGVDEDPVTGSAHSQLIPFWSEKLDKTKMFAKQLSPRGGEIWCEQLNAERVTMSGECVFYLEGEIYLNNVI